MVDFGDGSDGEIIFTTTTKSYGSLVLGVDYNVSGNTLYLFPDREYNFTNLTLGSGTILTTDTSRTTGAVLYIQCTGTANIAGSVRLDYPYTSIMAGTGSVTTWASPLGNITGPGVANGGSGGAGGDSDLDSGGSGGAQGTGFGGGGGGGAGAGLSDGRSGGSGGAGGSSPTGGAGTLAEGPGEDYDTGNNGSQSGGGSGGAAIEDADSSDEHMHGGYGGGSHGAVGDSANRQNLTSGTDAGGGGGGGGGGSAGREGLHFYLISLTINFTGNIVTSGYSATSGGAGGDGEDYGLGCAGGGGGGGGGGGNAGNIKFNYGELIDSGTKYMSNGSAGSGGNGGLRAGLDASHGTAGSAGTTGTSGTYSGTAEINSYAYSLPIDYNNGTITQAKLTATSTGGFIQYWLSADGGVNWEDCSSGILHTFTNTGTDLRWKAGGVAGVTLTEVIIESYH